MTKSNLILNRLFTQSFVSDIINKNSNPVWTTIVRRFVDDPCDKDNGTIISEIYKFMSKSYRNEYFYLNTLLNKLLLGKHNVNTTTALTQIPVGKSKADFILINGKAVVYEIKTELDTFDRLHSQLNDYFKAFNHVCVVIPEGYYEKAVSILGDSPVGIYTLTPQNTISRKLRKEPIENDSQLDHITMFKVLRKHEYESILLKHFQKLPVTSQAFYFDRCLEKFCCIPILEASKLAVQQLKKRNRIETDYFDSVPYELKSLLYFHGISEPSWKAINQFLSDKHGG